MGNDEEMLIVYGPIIHHREHTLSTQNLVQHQIFAIDHAYLGTQWSCSVIMQWTNGV